MVVVEKKKRGRKPKNNDKRYFDEEVEKAIILYNSQYTSDEERTRLYEKIIHGPLKKIASIQARTFHYYFTERVTIDDMIDDAVIHLYNNLAYFKPDAVNKNGDPVKAFSYFSTICKNHLKKLSEESYNHDKNNDSVDIYYSMFDQDVKHSYELDIDNGISKNDMFFSKIAKNMIEKINQQLNTGKSVKENDYKVGRALITIFENIGVLYEPSEEDFSNHYMRKKIIEIIKEITGIKTNKEVNNSLKTFKSLYFISKNENSDILDND